MCSTLTDQRFNSGAASCTVRMWDRSVRCETIAHRRKRRRVVHLLDGDAYAFTTSYLHARLGLAQESDKSTDQVINGAEPPWPDATTEGVENA